MTAFRDAWRVHLESHPKQLAKIVAESPTGPLAMPYRTGKRKHSAGVPRRYDSIWVSDDYQIQQVWYLYDESVAIGSGHALVITEIDGNLCSISRAAFAQLQVPLEELMNISGKFPLHLVV